jgi:cold shock protein
VWRRGEQFVLPGWFRVFPARKQPDSDPSHPRYRTAHRRKTRGASGCLWLPPLCGAITQAAGRRRNERLATQKSVSPFSPEEIVVAATQDRVHCTLVRAGSGSRRLIMATGTVKWFNPTKGYGFIQPQGGGQDVFVHISAVERAGLSTLNEGQQVEYEVVSNRGKSSAENLKVK